VLQAELFPAIAANPFFEFSVRAVESGTLDFVWKGDHGFLHREQRPISVA
jgi:sulfur-oxidizing protein SoxZ